MDCDGKMWLSKANKCLVSESVEAGEKEKQTYDMQLDYTKQMMILNLLTDFWIWGNMYDTHITKSQVAPEIWPREEEQKANPVRKLLTCPAREAIVEGQDCRKVWSTSSSTYHMMSFNKRKIAIS